MAFDPDQVPSGPQSLDASQTRELDAELSTAAAGGGAAHSVGAPRLADTQLYAPDPSSRDPQDSADSTPRFERVGNCRIERVLGQGGFGIVYLGFDELLKRRVAIKVPRRERLARSADADAYLAEARVVAKLEHPGIVPVFAAERTQDGLCYVVSRYVEGESLAAHVAHSPPSFAESAKMIAEVADALHHAHLRGVVHRDIKPQNILLDQQRRALLTDFGLALSDAEFGTGPASPGTPHYMSPEQAMGEGHRVDGRSDVFSLGVVLYELLTRRRPFQSTNWSGLREAILSLEPKPPRQIDENVPRELERICFKALEKRVTQRYTTAKDMADDLRTWLAETAGPADARRRADALEVEFSVSRQPTKSRPRWWHWFIAVAVLCLVSLAGAVTSHLLSTTDALSDLEPDPAPASAPAPVATPQAAADVADALRVTSVEFSQLMRAGEHAHHPPRLILRLTPTDFRQEEYRARLGDAVRFRATLSRPAYCFWLALQPDGTLLLVTPSDPTTPPAMTDRPRYPKNGRGVFEFTDGVGDQMFVLVASLEPLPAFEEWVRQLGPSPWQATSSPSELIVHHDGEWVEAIDPDATRGVSEDAPNSAGPIGEVVRWLKKDNVLVDAWLFPVREPD